jgi:flavin reductase (DIM6/NTAB) family NADH-FMN oxidoreductase RutF
MIFFKLKLNFEIAIVIEFLIFVKIPNFMLTIDPKELSPMKLQGYLQSAIAPRPIAFASTIDKNGKPNLSPFSFFNIFSSNPPILVFSPARRVRNNTTKHTLINCEETRRSSYQCCEF